MWMNFNLCLGDNGRMKTIVESNGFDSRLVVVYGFAALVQIIILMNMIISVVSDVFEKIQATKVPQEYLLKCGAMEDAYHLFRFILKPKDDTYYLRYLQVKKDDDVGGGEWQGKIAAVTTTIKTRIDNMQGKMQSEID